MAHNLAVHIHPQIVTSIEWEKTYERNLAVHIHPQIVTSSGAAGAGKASLQFTSIRRLLPCLTTICDIGACLQFTSIRRLLHGQGYIQRRKNPLAVHIHPQIVTPAIGALEEKISLAVHIHPQIVTNMMMYTFELVGLAVHIHPQIVTAISCVQQVYPTLFIEQPGNMDMIIGSISEEIRQHSCERLFPFLFTVNSHIVAAPHDKIFFTVFVVFSFYVSRISGHSVYYCTHIPGHHPILPAYHLQLQTDFYIVV